MITRKKYSKKKNFTLKKGGSSSSPRIGVKRRGEEFVYGRQIKRTASSISNDKHTYKKRQNYAELAHRQNYAELAHIDRLAQARNKSPQRGYKSPRRNLQSPKSRPQPDESAGRKRLPRKKKASFAAAEATADRKTLPMKQNQSRTGPPRPFNTIDVRENFRQRSHAIPADDFTALSGPPDFYDDMRRRGETSSPSKQKKLPFTAHPVAATATAKAAIPVAEQVVKQNTFDKLSSSLLRNLSLSILADNYDELVR